MKKVKVSSESCIGCGACVAIDPVHFTFNDEGLSVAINQENLESEEVKNAIESCPTSAINYIEVTESCECDNCECVDCNCGEECDCGPSCECGEDCNCHNCNCDCE